MGILARRLKRLRQRARPSAGCSDVSEDIGLASTLDVFAQFLPVRRSDLPSSGSQICEGLTLYHDASDGVFSWQQTLEKSLTLTVYQFQGSYLSLAVGIGDSVIRDIRHGGYLRVKKDIHSSRPVAAFLRLNVQIDGRHQQMHQTLIVDRGERTTFFDLDGLPGEFGPVENAWLDLIFSDPQMAEITLVSLTVDDAVPDASNP